MLPWFMPPRIVAKTKEAEPLLQLADLVAHGLYKCVDKSHACFGVTEPRYINEIANNFYYDTNTRKIINKGIKPIYSLSDLDLDRETNSFLDSLQNNLDIGKQRLSETQIEMSSLST